MLQCHLYAEYGVRSILLEGISKTLADKYNSPKYRGRKLSVGDSKSVTFKVWFDLLNENQWHLVPAYEKNTFGPLTQLGYEYTLRIQKVFGIAKEKGWFRSRQEFVDNQAQLTALINKACEGYNDRLDALLKEDPGLKKEYDITVIQRNKVFIDNSMAVEGPPRPPGYERDMMGNRRLLARKDLPLIPLLSRELWNSACRACSVSFA